MNSFSFAKDENNMQKREKGVMDKKFPNDGGFIPVEGKDDGIGIEKFLRGKVILITGATGFLGKALVEKILRAAADVNKLYVVIRAKNKEAAKERLETEFLEAELFKCVKEKYGKGYESFMKSKIHPVVGNMNQPNLGMEQLLYNEIKRDVQIIVNSAANTTLFSRYDVALNDNVMGPYHVMDFAKKCFKLELFLHVSTVFVNKPRPGEIMEGKLSWADFIGSKIPTSQSNNTWMMILENEKKLADDCKKHFGDDATPKLKALGTQRAKEFGLPNVYTWSKVLGEMMLLATKMEEIPLVIIRPPIIESALKEPFPGWLEGNKTAGFLLSSYGKGILTAMLGNANYLLDVVPVDLIVNATLAAMAKHGLTKKADINIYQVSSSTSSNRLPLLEIFNLAHQHYTSFPYIDLNSMPISIKKFKLFMETKDFYAHLQQEAEMHSSIMTPSVQVKLMEQVKVIAEYYRPFFSHPYRFNNSNTQKLFESLSEEEEKKFGFDVSSIDWKDYFTNVHIPGLQKVKGSSKL